MLLGFLVKNYRSIKDLQILRITPMEKPCKYLEELEKSSNVTLLYGANSSGKSNLIRAMDYARKSIFDNEELSHIDKFKGSDIDRSPSYFEFILEIDKKIYRYGFERKSKRAFTFPIKKEWLYSLEDCDFKCIYEIEYESKIVKFRHTVKDYDTIFPPEELKSVNYHFLKLTSFADKTDENSGIDKNTILECKKILRWFNENLIIKLGDSKTD